jgi:hypothetical protein
MVFPTSHRRRGASFWEWTAESYAGLGDAKSYWSSWPDVAAEGAGRFDKDQYGAQGLDFAGHDSLDDRQALLVEGVSRVHSTDEDVAVDDELHPLLSAPASFTACPPRDTAPMAWISLRHFARSEDPGRRMRGTSSSGAAEPLLCRQSSRSSSRILSTLLLAPVVISSVPGYPRRAMRPRFLPLPYGPSPARAIEIRAQVCSAEGAAGFGIRAICQV